MSVKRIHLIRHGETTWNKQKRIQGRSESVLTPEGENQARNLSSSLEEFNISRVYCSSSTRTRQTAELAFLKKPVTFTYCDELREIFLGGWEGSLWAEMKTRYPEQATAFWEQPENFLLDGAETFHDVQQRAMSKFREILNDTHADIAIVSHGVLIKTILCYLEGRPLAQLWEPPHMHNCAHSIVECRAGHAPVITCYAGMPVGAPPQQQKVNS